MSEQMELPSSDESSFGLPTTWTWSVFSSVATIVLQIHYENAAQRDDNVDSTGINVYTTHDLRPHQASAFSVGDAAGLAIPAGQEAFGTIHYCREETTRTFFAEPVHVYGSWLHAHRIGRGLWTEQRRGGEVVGELGRNDPYDFGLQYCRSSGR